jgi:hypothetical protein
MNEANPKDLGGDNSKPRRVPPRAHDYLNGMSPHQRAMEKQQAALMWVYEWGVSSDDIVRQVVDQQARGYAAKLVKRNLLVQTPTESGGFIRGVPRYFYTLSAMGLAEAERHATVPMRYTEINISKVTQRLLHHNLVAQQITCDISHSLVGKRYFSDRRLATRMNGKLKRPDAVLFAKNTNNQEFKLAIEVELTAKWERDLDQFIYRMIETLNEEDESIKVDCFYIFSDSRAILERYKKAIEPGMPLQRWEKDQFGKWVSRNNIEVPEYLVERVFFFYLDDWRKKHGR